jgi:hypothetical protein
MEARASSSFAITRAGTDTRTGPVSRKQGRAPARKKACRP